MALFTFSEGLSEAIDNDPTLREGSADGDDFVTLWRSKEVAIDIDLTHSGTVSVTTHDLENPDVTLTTGETITGGTRIRVPAQANGIKFSSSAGHGVTIDGTTAGVIKVAEESINRYRGVELRVVIGTAVDQS